jgi:hypothetical protein
MTDMNNFYYLGSPRRLRAGLSADSVYGSIEWYSQFRDAEARGISFEQVNCSLDPRHRRGGTRTGNLQLILPTSRPSDFIWTWMGPVVKNDVLSVFKSGGFTGFEAEPASILEIKGRGPGREKLFPDVWELKITGKGGDAHPDSGIHLLYSCPECGYTRYSSFQEGILVNQQNWDRSDFFTISGYPLFTMITERVKDAIVSNKFTNCAIIKTEDLRWGDNIPRPEDHPENFVPTRVTLKSSQSS